MKDISEYEVDYSHVRTLTEQPIISLEMKKPGGLLVNNTIQRETEEHSVNLIRLSYKAEPREKPYEPVEPMEESDLSLLRQIKA